MFPSPFPLYILVFRGEKWERMWGVVLLFHSYRYSSPKTWSPNGSMLLLSPVFSCELLWVLWNRIWVFPLYPWPLWFLYSFVDLRTTFLPEFSLLSGFICLRCVNAHVLSFIADIHLSLDFRLVVSPVTSNLWLIVENSWECKLSQFVGWFDEECKQCFIKKTSFLQSKKKLKVTTL